MNAYTVNYHDMTKSGWIARVPNQDGLFYIHRLPRAQARFESEEAAQKAIRQIQESGACGYGARFHIKGAGA